MFVTCKLIENVELVGNSFKLGKVITVYKKSN